MKYSFNPDIFKAYDIRGKVSEFEISEEATFFIGLCLGVIIKKGVVCVGMDARLTSIILKQKLIEGLTLMGIDVIDLGVVPTPLCYFSIPFLKANASVMITGSHNQIEYNGFKITLESQSLSGQELLKFVDIAKNGITSSLQKGFVKSLDISTVYINKIFESICFQKKPLRIGIDAMNGSGGAILKNICKMLPFEFILRNCEMTGDFNKILPEPSKPSNVSNLQNFLKTENLDFVFGFDGDADRVLLITPNKVWYGDDVTLFLAVNILKTNPERKVIFDVKSSIILEEEIKKLNGIPVIYKTGHSLIKQKMQEVNAILAGEMSGHVYINDGKFYPFDDGIYCFIRLLECLCKANELPTFTQTFRTPEIKIKVKDKNLFLIEFKKKMLELKPTKLLEIDGIKAYFKNSHAILARASNTEDVIIMIIESYSEAKLNELKLMVLEFVKTHEVC